MKKKFYRGIIYQIVIVSKYFFYILPYRVGFSLAGSLGKIIFYLLRRDRRKIIAHLKLAFGEEKTKKELRSLGRNTFEHYGKTAFELAVINKIIAHFDDFVTATGYEHFDKALQAGKGAVVTIAHFGNWEIMGGYTALKGYPCTVIARKIYYEKYDQILVGIREKMKVKTIYRDESVRTMLRVLKQNGMLGFVADQDVEGIDGVFVNFFNRPAYTPTAPVRFAMTSGAPIIPVFIVREGMRHRMIVEPAIDLVESGDREADVQANTQKWVAVQEKYIRRYPHLWAWNHKRWKTTPQSLQNQKKGAVV